MIASACAATSWPMRHLASGRAASPQNGISSRVSVARRRSAAAAHAPMTFSYATRTFTEISARSRAASSRSGSHPRRTSSTPREQVVRRERDDELRDSDVVVVVLVPRRIFSYSSRIQSMSGPHTASGSRATSWMPSSSSEHGAARWLPRTRPARPRPRTRHARSAPGSHAARPRHQHVRSPPVLSHPCERRRLTRSL